MNQAKKDGIKVLPYLMIFIFSLIGSYVLFYKGIGSGDDIYFHFANIIDIYETIKSGHSLQSISGNLAMGLGVGNRLFYSPLPHLSIAMLALIAQFFHLSIITSYKIMMFLSIFISGIFMYRFIMHLSKNNQSASLIAAAVFILYPYRMFDIYSRAAIGEAFGITFLPLFFMGLYDIVHLKDNISKKPFIEVIIGGSFLYLSHNVLGFYGFLIGIIYLLVHFKSIIRLFSKKNFVVYCVLSIFFMLGLCAISWVSQFELLQTKLYNVSNPEWMWTSASQVAHHTIKNNEWDLSIFFTFEFRYGIIAILGNNLYLITDTISFLCLTLISVFIDQILKRIPKMKYFHDGITFIFLLTFLYLLSNRVEVYLAGIVFYMLYIFFSYFKEKESNTFNFNLLKNRDFYFLSVILFFLAFCIYSDWIWYRLPSIFLNIQFPWRLWAFIQVFFSILVGFVCTSFKRVKYVFCVGGVLASFMLILNQPIMEKRIFYENGKQYWIENVDKKFLDYNVALGFNKEYCPQVFFDSSYQSKYTKSLYNRIRTRLQYDFTKEDYAYKPVLLTGKGDIIVENAYAPKYTLEVTITEAGIIQMPLFYYPGYQIKVIRGAEIKNIPCENIDGLVAFQISEGNYTIQIQYVGTKARQLSFQWFYFSIIGLGLFIQYQPFNKNIIYLLNEDKIKSKMNKN